MNREEILRNELLKHKRAITKIKDAQRRIERDKREKFEKELRDKNRVSFYLSGDYAGMSCKNFSFYYGYEETLCPRHGANPGCACESLEWCFVARDALNNEICCYPGSQLTWDTMDVLPTLLCGIGLFINNYTTPATAEKEEK